MVARNPRRKGLTLDVALAYARENKHATPAFISELEKIAAEYNARDRAFDSHRDRRRIAMQRSTFAAAVGGAAVGDELRRAMLDRAWALLDGGQAEACDALLEFLPEADAERMLHEYVREDEGETA